MLVVGLGNPGPRYAQTRHNIGFDVVDELARRHAASYREKFKGHFARVLLGTHDLILLRPTTFMNRSGESVQPAASFFGVEAPSVVVVHDELDLPFGRLKVKVRGGHGGHNGLRSITEHIGADYVRVRCGIGRPPGGDTTPWVLGRFGPEDAPFVADLVSKAADAVERIIIDGAGAAMNEFNSGA